MMCVALGPAIPTSLKIFEKLICVLTTSSGFSKQISDITAIATHQKLRCGGFEKALKHHNF